MKVLVIGANGFVGRHLTEELLNDKNIDTVTSSREGCTDHVIDLLDRKSIRSVLDDVLPDVVISCAGIINNTDNAYLNRDFCNNLFVEIVGKGAPYPKVILSGSASVYGEVGDENRIVNEDTALNATSNYGRSKIQEEEVAFQFAKRYDMNVVIARIFNPIGSGMGEKFLMTNLLKQIVDIKSRKSSTIEISRLDSLRDYIDVRDVARALHSIALKDDHAGYRVLNIGSGHATSNGEILESMLRLVELDEKPTIIETRTEPEPLYASCADISRIKSEYNWEPKYDLVSTIEEIIHESGK